MLDYGGEGAPADAVHDRLQGALEQLLPLRCWLVLDELKPAPVSDEPVGRARLLSVRGGRQVVGSWSLVPPTRGSFSISLKSLMLPVL